MRVSIEDETHRLGRELGDFADQLAGAAGIIGVDHDKVVVHLNDDVVAVAFGGVAGKKPDAVGDFFGVEMVGLGRFGLGR